MDGQLFDSKDAKPQNLKDTEDIAARKAHTQITFDANRIEAAVSKAADTVSVKFTSSVLDDVTAFIKDALLLTRKEYITKAELDRFDPKGVDDLMRFIEYIGNEYGLDISVTAESATRTISSVQEADSCGTIQTPNEPIEPTALTDEDGVITSLNGHVATIADKLLQYCFTSRNLKALPGERNSFSFDNAGKLQELSLNDQPLQPLDDIHTGFLMALLQLANSCDIREYNSKDNPSLGVRLPAFFRETHIDPRPREWDKQTKTLKKRQRESDQTIKKERLHRFIEFMKPLDNRVGIIPGEGYYTVARFISWDEPTDTAYIAIPYEIKLAEIARLHADQHSAISTIFRAEILTENQAAVELANRIAVGLIERGVRRSDDNTYKNPRKPLKKKITRTAADGTKTVEELTFAPEPEATETKSATDENGVTTTVTKPIKADRVFTWEDSFSSLIKDCPQLQREIDAIRSSDSKDKSQRVNKKLKDVFTAAVRIIMEKSDIPRYYKDLTIRTGRLDSFKAPTNSTLNDKLVIQHHGKNPGFIYQT